MLAVVRSALVTQRNCAHFNLLPHESRTQVAGVLGIQEAGDRTPSAGKSRSTSGVAMVAYFSLYPPR